MPVPEKLIVVLYKSEEGYSVSVPELPGCLSQGKTEKEALTNIEDAIGEYLSVAAEGGLLRDSDEVRRERYRKLANLLHEWEADSTSHGKEFWPILEAELNRHDD